ncbi:hypothetical protein SEUCBS139899_007611 [Sporothrix eucalyptigena]
MGLSGEQDTELLASFRAAVMNEADSVDADIIQIYPGSNADAGGNQPPVHFNMIRDEFMPLDNATKKASSDRIENAVHGCADHLVRLYFKHVHPVYPVLSKTRFLQSYVTDKQAIPASLRGAIYGIASNFWYRDQNQRSKASTTATTTPASTTISPPLCAAIISRLDQHELFEHALASLQRELHGPNMWTLQACLLLIHENAAENATVETPRVWMLAAQAVACAQMIGLHRDPMAWQLAGWEKHLRRKLWWATFAADVWSSVCHAPMHLSYYAAVALNFRALMSPVTKAAKQDPGSSLRRHFRSAIKDFGSFIEFMHGISPDCLHAFWGLHARSQFILCGNFLIYLFLLAPNHDEVRDTFALLGKFHDSLQRLSAVADKFAIGVLRPVALRIDSFFTQAAQVMRTNGQSPPS